MREFQGDTNKVTKVKLSSAIEHVMWTTRIAAPGATVTLEVFTLFVGNGASIKIELSDHNGKRHGTYNETIAGNHFWATIIVPEDAKQALYADIKLSKHGLSGQSNALLLTEPVKIKNLKWSAKVATRNDVLKLTAEVEGVPDGSPAEISIWEHDSDGAHDLVSKIPVTIEGQKVETEWEFEYQEDTDDIPTQAESASGYNPPEFFFRVMVYGLYVDSDLLEFKDSLELELLEYDGEPIANAKYEVTIADGTKKTGSLDSAGKVSLKELPPGPVEIEYPDLENDES